jgi:hypothetical protein
LPARVGHAGVVGERVHRAVERGGVAQVGVEEPVVGTARLLDVEHRHVFVAELAE